MLEGVYFSTWYKNFYVLEQLRNCFWDEKTIKKLILLTHILIEVFLALTVLLKEPQKLTCNASWVLICQLARLKAEMNFILYIGENQGQNHPELVTKEEWVLNTPHKSYLPFNTQPRAILNIL